MDDIYGAVFPIPEWYVERFFTDNKRVFIKPAALFRFLRPELKFYFYQSRKNTGIVGEATIKQIILKENPLDFFEIFGDTIFLQKKELQAYIDDNKNKKWIKKRKQRETKTKRPWIAIELENITKYKKTIKIDGFVPVSGKYVKNRDPF